MRLSNRSEQGSEIGQAHIGPNGSIGDALEEIANAAASYFKTVALLGGIGQAVVKPTSGGGIYYGLLSADIAVETLTRALEDGDLSAKRLARYQREWKKLLGRELKVGYWARKLFERLSDRQIDRVFEIVKAGGINETLLKAEDLTFDWHSRTILTLLKYQMVAKAMNIVRLPFRAGKIDR